MSQEQTEAQGVLLKWCPYGQHFVPATTEYFSLRGKHLYSYCKDCVSKQYHDRAGQLKLKRMAKKGR